MLPQECSIDDLTEKAKAMSLVDTTKPVNNRQSVSLRFDSTKGPKANAPAKKPVTIVSETARKILPLTPPSRKLASKNLSLPTNLLVAVKDEKPQCMKTLPFGLDASHPLKPQVTFALHKTTAVNKAGKSSSKGDSVDSLTKSVQTQSLRYSTEDSAKDAKLISVAENDANEIPKSARKILPFSPPSKKLARKLATLDKLVPSEVFFATYYLYYFQLIC
jgi:hypothetical protein